MAAERLEHTKKKWTRQCDIHFHIPRVYLGYSFTKHEVPLQKTSEKWRQLLQSKQMQTKLFIFTKFCYYILDIFCCQRKWFPDKTHLQQFLLDSRVVFDEVGETAEYMWQDCRLTTQPRQNEVNSHCGV